MWVAGGSVVKVMGSKGVTPSLENMVDEIGVTPSTDPFYNH